MAKQQPIKEVPVTISISDADTKLQPKWKNEPTFNDLSKDLRMSDTSHTMFREALLQRNEQFAGGKPIVTNAKGKSTTRPKLIRKQAEWKYASLEEPFLSTRDMFKIDPRTAEDADAATQNQILINYQWATKVPKVKLLNDVTRNVVDEGTVIVKVGWRAEEGTKIVAEEVPEYASPEQSVALLRQKIDSGELSYEAAQQIMSAGQPMQTGTKTVYSEKTILVKNQPTYEVCNNANVRIDPTCEGILADANFIIHEYDTSFAELKKDEHIITWDEEEYLDPKTADVATKKVKNERGFYKNLDVLKDMNIETAGDVYGSIPGQTFRFADKPRKKARAYEYWGYWDINGDDTLVPIVATWVSGIMIRLEENPFPHKRLPFAIATYMPVKREIHGQADGDLLVDNQNTIGRMIRAAEDITITQAVGQTFVDEQLFPSPVQKSNYEKGNTVYFRHGLDPRTSIYRQNVDAVPASVFQLIQSQNAEAESLSGTKAFSDGISGNAFGTVAAGARGAMDATAKRELSILLRLSEMFKDIARMTVSMNQAFLEEQEVIRITNNFVAIRRDDLNGEFDFDMDISTQERDNDTSQKLTMLLQTNAASMNPEIQHKMYKKLAMLWKMPDLAKDLGEYTPPSPRPEEEAMRALQLEALRLENIKLQKQIEELDSRITDRISRAIENQSDVTEKDSKALFEQAKARKLNTESDLNDQRFTDSYDGKDMQNKMVLNAQQHDNNMTSQQTAAEHKRLADLDKIAFKHQTDKATKVADHVRGKDMFDHQSPLVDTEGGAQYNPEASGTEQAPVDQTTTEGTTK
ncbi:MAG: hypothetical protein JHC33_11630 [Ignisphaera sp.]|nr:hypothetical protein [Ignisphaera sp.]